MRKPNRNRLGFIYFNVLAQSEEADSEALNSLFCLMFLAAFIFRQTLSIYLVVFQCHQLHR
jgi:hypothetical protein